MNDDRSFERFVADHVGGLGAMPLPDDFYDDVHAFASDARQRPEWLALIKEPPMRTHSRLAVGSPTTRAVAAIMAATLLLAVGVAAAGVAGQRLLAAATPIVVAQDGTGDAAAIDEAVAMAVDGDTILVKPGIYRESVVIDKDVTLRGEDKEGVVLEFAEGCEMDEWGTECPEGTPLYWKDTIPGRPGIGEGGPFGLHLIDTDAEIAHLTIRDLCCGTSIVMDGGAPVIEDVELSDNGHIAIYGSSAAIVRDSEFGSSSVDEPGPVTFSGNVIHRGLDVHNQDPEAVGDPVVIRENELGGVSFFGPVIIEGNRFSEVVDGDPTIAIWASGTDWVIRDNVIRGYETGIRARARGVVEDNVIEGNGIGFDWEGDAPVMSGNRICDNPFGNVRDLSEVTQPLYATNEVCADGDRITR